MKADEESVHEEIEEVRSWAWSIAAKFTQHMKKREFEGIAQWGVRKASIGPSARIGCYKLGWRCDSLRPPRKSYEGDHV